MCKIYIYIYKYLYIYTYIHTVILGRYLNMGHILKNNIFSDEFQSISFACILKYSKKN